MSFAESNGVHAPMQSSVASEGSTEPYYPLMPPISSSPSPTETYQVPADSVSLPVAGAGDTSVITAVTPVSVDPITSIEPAKRKRGRPRKYAPPDGIISPQSLSAAQSGGGFSPPEGVKKGRGRPPGPGSGRKQQFGDLGSAGAGIGFRPHVITLRAGEDVLAKLMSFSHSTSQAVCILSANGSISNVTLQQAAISGGTVTYEGQFEILSLSGYFLLSETGGERSRTGGLSVLLAGPDGHVLGGGVAGVLTAASAVQVIVGSFTMQGQKQLKLDHSDVFGTPSTMVSGASAAKSPSSLGTVSESSGEPVSPHNQLVETSNNSTPVVANNLPWR
ncbi:AT-hook motif nuclear-localized protein 10-like isoform X1 [Nicotiana tomentosiformis]|uniref:AT-hook motif nuclear-localized protein 10-like isoform X1 n=1 Tax=Nicotiana tomentosiformis TaxID=4098 RepID=UPI00051C9029|nr:AT-hook motif nuclear-localized protein 10-like isoform X1 [Nicotiana tomentosiformis]XP_016492820.1 PREDICTED: AT-hook motif nuclear-localized protein 10-like [Nicotiana tabacum]